MKVIVGLGNSGLRFEFSRHNLGFLVVEKLAQAKNIRITKRAYECLFGEGIIESQEVLIAKPLTFVNLSGVAASAIFRQRKIHLEDLLIVCDDINLPLGKIRIRPKGSDGGHKGLRSIITALGSSGFARLRVGISTPKPRSGKYQLSKFVLQKFSKREVKIIDNAIEEAVDCCKVWATEGIESAMNRFNRKGD